ncbi:efflux RND transporter permease subunit [Microbacterium aquimaris]|uniref:Efflux RND transporter permease subunit n=1 Tax=Microbacterium aquimaris TaxID=459816 RepID=A0ABU5N377_9MICO|nr:efflux RND transporter permease subunit [Microbacterium aquimaris]MDZ8160531.1 efflux RND transporter permease subunit [Microbacterium aquimaris]
MSNLAVLSLKNRALIALITIVAAVFGGIALNGLKQELIPSIEFPALIVVSTYPGASPEVVNTDVSTPIESAIQGVPGLESSTATSTTNASIVQASFAYDTDLGTAEQKMTQAINRISSQLPDGVEPTVISASIDDLPVIQLAVTGYDDPDTIQSELESVVIPDIEDVDGVDEAGIVGAIGQRITITPDDAELAAAGYSEQAISDALEQNGVLFPGGEITEDGETLTVQTGVKITSVEEVGELPLVPGDAEQLQAGLVTISDVADVQLTEDPRTSISRVNGEPALTIAVTKLPAANTVDVSHGVTALLAGFEDSLGAQFTVVFDQAPYIEESIETLAVEGMLGLVFAVLVILLFLMSVRSTLVTAISIPTSVLITFIGIQTFGYSLNILTLGALTISIGRVVDDSIVVIENIKRHYVGDADKKQSILLAVREVATAITSSTITTVAVFLPIAFVGDITGELFRPFALTVTIAMLASLLVALTIVPVLAYWFLKPGKPVLDEKGRAIDPEDPAAPPTRLQKGYLPVLRWTLRHSWVTLTLAVLVLGGTVAAAPFMKTNFLGDSGQNTFTISQSIGAAPSLDAEAAAAEQVEAELSDIEGIETVQVSIGTTGSSLNDAFSGGGAGVTYSITTDEDVDQVTLREEVTEVLGDLEGAGDITVSASGGGGFGSSDIAIDVTAPDSTTLQEATDEVVAAIGDLDDISQVSSNLSASLPYIAVVVDRDAAAERGLSEVAVGALVSNTMQPQSIGSIEIDDTAVTVYLDAPDAPVTLEELRELQIPTATGPIALDEIASVEETEGPTSITTARGQRTATVTVTPSTDDLTAATASVTTALEDIDLPQGADAELGGVVTQQTEAFTQLGLALLAAILIVYIVMVATFKSLRQPLLLLVSVPFAATGAILLQIATGVPLGVSSLIGVLMLIGIVVTNAIVLVDLVNQYREKGLSAHDATVAGGARRLRPILMTALATIFALTPMALGITGQGGFISQPLAIVVIGGLVSSTVLTLLVLPTLYNLVEGAKERRIARRAAKAGASGAVDERESVLVGDEDGSHNEDGVFETRRERRERLAALAAASAVPAASAAEVAEVDVPMIEEAPDVEVSVDEPAPVDAAAAADPEAIEAIEATTVEAAVDTPPLEQAPDVEVPSTAEAPDAASPDASSDDLGQETDADSASLSDAEDVAHAAGGPEDLAADAEGPAPVTQDADADDASDVAPAGEGEAAPHDPEDGPRD